MPICVRAAPCGSIPCSEIRLGGAVDHAQDDFIAVRIWVGIENQRTGIMSDIRPWFARRSSDSIPGTILNAGGDGLVAHTPATASPDCDSKATARLMAFVTAAVVVATTVFPQAAPFPIPYQTSLALVSTPNARALPLESAARGYIGGNTYDSARRRHREQPSPRSTHSKRGRKEPCCQQCHTRPPQRLSAANKQLRCLSANGAKTVVQNHRIPPACAVPD